MAGQTRTGFTRRGRLALGSLLAAAALLCGTIASTGPASATPAATAQVTPTQVASAPYGALFALGVPVYELFKVRRAADVYPTSNELLFRKLNGPGDGRHGTQRFVFIGQPLPSTFSVAASPRLSYTPSGLILPINPRTLQRSDAPGHRYQMISMLTGPIGEVSGVGLATGYLG